MFWQEQVGCRRDLCKRFTQPLVPLPPSPARFGAGARTSHVSLGPSHDLLLLREKRSWPLDVKGSRKSHAAVAEGDTGTGQGRESGAGGRSGEGRNAHIQSLGLRHTPPPWQPPAAAAEVIVVAVVGIRAPRQLNQGSGGPRVVFRRGCGEGRRRRGVASRGTS